MALTDADRLASNSHTIDRLATDLATCRRALQASLTLLEEVPHMIEHDRDEVALDHIDRAKTRLAAAFAETTRTKEN